MDRLVNLIDHTEGVYLRQLPPWTTLLVRTTNSLYRVLVTDGSNVYVQGGTFFPYPTAAHLHGDSLGGSALKVGWIGVGLLMEFQIGGTLIVTSPVRAITKERVSNPIVH